MGPKLPSQARGRLLPWDGLSGPRGTPPDAVPASLGFVQTWELTSVQEAPAPSGPAPPVNLTETAAASAQLLLLPSGLALLQHNLTQTLNSLEQNWGKGKGKQHQ